MNDIEKGMNESSQMLSDLKFLIKAEAVFQCLISGSSAKNPPLPAFLHLCHVNREENQYALLLRLDMVSSPASGLPRTSEALEYDSLLRDGPFYSRCGAKPVHDPGWLLTDIRLYRGVGLTKIGVGRQ